MPMAASRMKITVINPAMIIDTRVRTFSVSMDGRLRRSRGER
jgi:hypothetical protein